MNEAGGSGVEKRPREDGEDTAPSMSELLKLLPDVLLTDTNVPGYTRIAAAIVQASSSAGAAKQRSSAPGGSSASVSAAWSACVLSAKKAYCTRVWETICQFTGYDAVSEDDTGPSDALSQWQTNVRKDANQVSFPLTCIGSLNDRTFAVEEYSVEQRLDDYFGWFQGGRGDERGGRMRGISACMQLDMWATSSHWSAGQRDDFMRLHRTMNREVHESFTLIDWPTNGEIDLTQLDGESLRDVARESSLTNACNAFVTEYTKLMTDFRLPPSDGQLASQLPDDDLYSGSEADDDGSDEEPPPNLSSAGGGGNTLELAVPGGEAQPPVSEQGDATLVSQANTVAP
jgi:hypothetical protein